jgi:L-ascorbate metabolism protein UlaG (beta-lactamase superfamily)
MIITHHGKQFFKLQTGDRVIALNPIAKESKFKTSGFGADVALITTNHPDYNGSETVSYGDRIPFIMSGPGEYELSGIIFRGYGSKGTDGKKDLMNAIYYFEFDGIKICFLGALYEGNISTEAREAIDDVDILFVPIGGKTVINAEAAAKLARTFEAKMVIPMDYGNDQEPDALKKFLKETSTKETTPVEKLTLKLRDLSGKEGEVVVFE